MHASELQLHLRQFTAMASACELQLYAADAAAAGTVLDAAVAEAARIEAKYSRYRPETVVARINAAAGQGDVDVDEETAALLDYAAACHAQSDGRFDITSGVLRRVWDFRSGVVPSAAQLAAVLALVGWDKARWQRPRFGLARAGMEIDLGGIGKEYAADRVAGVCRALGVRHGLVNLGGDLRVIGPHPDGRPWVVGIRHPRVAGATIASIALTDGALATSGDYERYFERDGVRYSHILDPRSGQPVRHWQSVSVIAPVCVAAGSFATIAMLLERRGARFLARAGVPHLLVDPDGRPRGPLAAAQ